MAEDLDHRSEDGGGGGEHPVLAAARVIEEALDRVVEVDPVFMSTSDKAAALGKIASDLERLHGLQLRVLAVAGDVAEETGARSPAAWLGQRTRARGREARAEGRLAEALPRWGHVQAGVLAGTVSVEQARVIVRALDALPSEIEAGVREKAELHLVEQAAHFDPDQLKLLGRRILDVVAPEISDDAERRALEAEEKHARETTRLTMRSRGDGTTDVAARLPDAMAARLRTYLEAYAAPRRGHLDPTVEHTDPESGARIPYPVLMGRAFCSLLEAVPTDKLPRHGGSPTTVVVTIDEQQLRDRVGAAGLSSGERISAGEALRLACTAGIVPMVLGGKGQPLHLGRTKRLYNHHQQLAMKIRDGHCRAEGCDIPADWCEAHHLKRPWAEGGRTDIDDGALLCPWHHHRAHDPDLSIEILANGDIRFHRRE